MKKGLPAAIFLVISLFFILVWFRNGHLFAGGDVGFQTFNPKRTFEKSLFVWGYAAVPGSAAPQGLSAVPLQFILSLFQAVGFSPVVLQATLFFVLLFLMGFGMYLFLRQKMEGKSAIYPILGGLFYMLNPYMMLQVWHRFIHTTIILAAVLPFFAIFWDQWIREGRLKSLVFFLLANFLAVYIYGTYAYIITVWIFLSLITTAALVPWSDRKKLLQIGGKFLFGFLLWVLINCWWLIPVSQISPAALSSQHKAEDSVANLILISAQAVLPYSLQLVNPFYTFYQLDFGPIYKSFLFQSIPWIFVLILLIGFKKSFKVRAFSLFGIFFIFALFLAKGSAPPLGGLYIFAFKKVFALGVLRNPFEKTGLILTFFACVLFTLGLVVVGRKFKHGYLFVGLIFVSILIYSWPMFAGKVFGNVNKRDDVEVPQSYKQANEWFIKQRAAGILDGNILHLPLTRNEAVQYNWQFGYNGLESSDQFFTAYPSISRGFNIQRVDDSLTALSLIFRRSVEDSGKILRLLQAFNVRFLILHKDLNWQGTDVDDPLEIEKVLNKLSFVEKKAEFGDLVIYQIANQFFSPKIEIQDSISEVSPQQVNMGIWPWLGAKSGSLFISPLQNQKIDDNIRNYNKEVLIFPQNAFTYPEASESSLEESTRQLIFQLNNLASAVASMKQLGLIEPKADKLAQDIILSSNKLVAVHNQQLPVGEYTDFMDGILSEIGNASTAYNDKIKNNISDVLKIHELFLSLMQKRLVSAEKERIQQSQDKIREFLRKENLLPYFEVSDKTSEIGQRRYFDFWVDVPGKYELVLTDARTKDDYTDKFSKVEFQINGQPEALPGSINDSLVSFGLIGLSAGLNEISLLNPFSRNLVSLENLTKIGNVKLLGDQIQMVPGSDSPSVILTPLGETVGNDIYQISFEGQIPDGVSAYIQIIQDSDPEEQGNKIPRISIQASGGQVTGWQPYKLQLPPLSIVTQKAGLRIAVVSSSSQLLSGSVMIRNLRVIRVLNNNIFLRSSLQGDKREEQGQAVNFTRISPARYEGTFNLQKPGFLFFKESYHQDWKLELTDGKQVFASPNHYLGSLYGNAWYIERAGQYKFKITFEPENSFYYGLALSGIGVVLSLGAYAILRKIKK